MAAKCCIHPPLLDGDEDMEILDLIMIPELHLHLGMVNRIAHVLNERWGENLFYRWCAEKNIFVKDYRSIQVQTCPNLSKLAQTCVNLPKLAQTCPKMSNFPFPLFFHCFDKKMGMKKDLAWLW